MKKDMHFGKLISSFIGIGCFTVILGLAFLAGVAAIIVWAIQQFL